MCLTLQAWSQNKGVGIGTANPEPSAILHVHDPSGSKGVLLPNSPRASIVADKTNANGLLTYDSATFFYWNNTFWSRILSTNSYGDVYAGRYVAINDVVIDDGMSPDISVKSVKANVDNNASDITLLQGQLAMLTNRVSSLESKVNVLENRFAKSGTIYLNDIAGREKFTVPLDFNTRAKLGSSSNYHVLGTLRESFFINGNLHLFWIVTKKTSTYFEIELREEKPLGQNVYFDYIIVKNDF